MGPASPAAGRQGKVIAQRARWGVRTFRLVSRWHLPSEVDVVWAELADPAFRWPRWWPGLRAEGLRTRGAGTAEPGSLVCLRVRSPLGWSLRFSLLLDAADEPRGGRPGTARLTVAGDLCGGADVTVEAVPGGTVVVLVWSVALARGGGVGRMLRALPRPVLVAGHAAVMRAGERGLVAELRRDPPTRRRARPCPRRVRSVLRG